MRGRSLLTVALLALTLIACDSTRHVGGRPPEADPVRAQAAKVAQAWAGSGGQQAWLHGYFPLDRQSWAQPDGLHLGNGLYGDLPNGVPQLRATLPPSGPTATVTWAGGTSRPQPQGDATLTLPLLSPAEVFRLLTENARVCPSGCPPLTVTAVRPGTRRIATSRGQATIPVWEFTIAGYDGAFAFPAVASQEAPLPRPSTDPAVRWAFPADWTGTTPDGRTVHGLVNLGCSLALDSAQTYETDSAVVPIARVHLILKPGQACSGGDNFVPADFHLLRPLGTRTVLNLLTGRPEGPQDPRPGHQ